MFNIWFFLVFLLISFKIFYLRIYIYIFFRKFTSSYGSQQRNIHGTRFKKIAEIFSSTFVSSWSKLCIYLNRIVLFWLNSNFSKNDTIKIGAFGIWWHKRWSRQTKCCSLLHSYFSNKFESECSFVMCIILYVMVPEMFGWICDDKIEKCTKNYKCFFIYRWKF